MKRTLKITSNNSLDFNVSIDDNKPTWYFVNWDNEVDADNNYTIYTNRRTFGKKIPVFKSKDWSIICKVGNLINGLFHSYFEISNSYPLEPLINIDTYSSKHP